jgi:hypothetical protein
MFKEFAEGLRRGYYEGYHNQPYVATAKTTNTSTAHSVSNFLGAWQRVTDRSERQTQELMQDPKWAKHFRALNWVITLAILAYIGSAFFN